MSPNLAFFCPRMDSVPGSPAGGIGAALDGRVERLFLLAERGS